MDVERSSSPVDRCEVEPAYPFGSMYQDFASKCREEPDGYDFHDPAVLRNVPPPTTSATKMPWWCVTRHRRLNVALKLRDALLRAILSIGRRHGAFEGRRPQADTPIVIPPQASAP